MSDEVTKSKEQIESEVSLARPYHQELHEHFTNSNNYITESSNQAIRSLFLINGGAVVALLALLAASIETQHEIALIVVKALQYFAKGVFAAAMTSVAAYLTNYCYGSSVYAQKRILNWPYVEETSSGKNWRRVGVFFHLVSLASAVGSLLMFVLGVCELGLIKDYLGNL